MDIHKLKPWHGVREFLKEYLIIVVGVLTALGAEQAVVRLHDRAAEAQARAAIEGELGRNSGYLLLRDRKQKACIVTRVGQLQRVWTTSSTARDGNGPAGSDAP